MASLPEKFSAFISQEKLFSRTDRLLLAVSGGIDSMVLCELCHLSGYQFEMAHCNFGLRGEESNRDEAFVRTAGERYGVPVHAITFDTAAWAAAHHVSTQVAARELRYNWFRLLITTPDSSAFGARLLTAHHLDDNIETSFMNFVKGTGIRGLRGMLPVQGDVIRPLLFATRLEIEEFAREQQLPWVEDSSNASDKYTRNFLRHNVLPQLPSIHPGALTNLGNNLERFRDVETLYMESVHRHVRRLAQKKDDEVHIPIAALTRHAAHRSILHEILKPFDFTTLQESEILHLCEGPTGKYVASPTHRVLRNRAWLIIAPVAVTHSGIIAIDSPGNYDFPGGSLCIAQPSVASGEGNANNVIIDSRSLQFPFLLRPWKTGDYFYPLGMSKKKKLARFFIDNKLSATQKEKMWVLEADKKIVWVLGMRIDDRVKITQGTTAFLSLQYTSK